MDNPHLFDTWAEQFVMGASLVTIGGCLMYLYFCSAEDTCTRSPLWKWLVFGGALVAISLALYSKEGW